jgi:hypothetical protein
MIDNQDKDLRITQEKCKFQQARLLLTGLALLKLNSNLDSNRSI